MIALRPVNAPDLREELADALDCPPLVLRALRLLLNEASPMTLRELARRCKSSRFHLCRLFTQSIGVSPIKLHRSLRLADALHRLETPPASRPGTLASLALEYGWSDQSHFTNSVRRLTGLPPGAYAKARHAARTVRVGAA